ncbi:sugar porter family MFS transporter [Colletotrichum graminicola M1.001]|uniref:Sugar porter family MFS transporter n=2 Tax=Colletotrichum graminicola TaxID=31870 RepID=E3QK46_COLGM|nr:sugar porter family MFS transporter [Colletotrichum graminicola M1.001]EFQ31234.1 sugar porter family MFS transporter [Colletotrichum graminicola M1.001]CBV37386.1 alpha glucoside transporter [Colletotrichum graminicola]
MSNQTDSKSTGEDPTKVESYTADVNHVSEVDEKAKAADFKADAIEAEQAEQNMGVLEAVKLYPMASLWAFIMSTTIIMESYCVFLMGAFVAMDEFKLQFGVLDREGAYQIEASWQSALQVGGPLGAIIGVCIAGPITSRIGYRWATITGLMVLNAFIFIFYFANSLAVMFVSQLLEGIPWGIFIANAPAYCSEIVPMRLRAPATQMLQMFWAIGAIIVGGVCYVYESKSDSSAWKVPIALQWMFPTPLAVLLFIAPESPWWLVRKGRLEEAAKSVRRLGRSTERTSIDESIAMMRRTIENEKSVKEPSYAELFKGTDRYRTLIVCGVYAAQNLTGNLIANQAVYFFRQAGIGSNLAFALGLITSALQTVFVMLSWILTTYLGRRTIYVWGSLINVCFLIALGIAGSVGESNAASLAMASLGLIVSVGFTLGPAPASWVIIAETSAVRLRPLTTGIGRAAYYIVNIPCIFLATYMLNPTGVNLGGRCGYVWGATGFVCFVVSYIWLPEMKGRSFREIDIMFKRRIPARQWKKTVIDINDDE